MKERPIIMSAPMVRAILEGRKTQTRRIVRPDGKYRLDIVAPSDGGQSRCPYGRPGDRLWVREAWTVNLTGDPKNGGEGTVPIYRAEHPNATSRWRSPIHMPRWASRITLDVTGVRVERLQDISDEDALAEGVYPTGTGLYPGSPRATYRELWESIHGPGSWDANPWVWVVEFAALAALRGEA